MRRVVARILVGLVAVVALFVVIAGIVATSEEQRRMNQQMTLIKGDLDQRLGVLETRSDSYTYLYTYFYTYFYAYLYAYLYAYTDYDSYATVTLTPT